MRTLLAGLRPTQMQNPIGPNSLSQLVRTIIVLMNAFGLGQEIVRLNSLMQKATSSPPLIVEKTARGLSGTLISHVLLITMTRITNPRFGL